MKRFERFKFHFPQLHVRMYNLHAPLCGLFFRRLRDIHLRLAAVSLAKNIGEKKDSKPTGIRQETFMSDWHKCVHEDVVMGLNHDEWERYGLKFQQLLTHNVDF